MGGCLSKSKPVEVKVELTLLDKEKDTDVMSPNGKASPFSDCRPNGALGHCSDEDSAPPRLYQPRDYVEASVCHVKDLENGQMREVDLGSGRALLIKEHGEFSAIAHKCPHYGAPLVKGVLSKGHVRCPWHGACFNIATGDIEDFPGLDSLPTFQVRVEKDKVIIRANKQDLQSQKRSKAMARCSAVINSSTGFSHILIVGSGPAGLVCAETLRQEGFTDRIVMCTMDKHPPYDRPKLSKSLESTAEQLRLRSIDFLQDHDIELLTEKEAVAVDVKTRAVTFQDGSRMEYRKLFIATGSKPKPMNYKGQDVKNVFHLRTPEDANCVARLANNRNAVIVGTSFVGMEVAAALTDKAHSVSIIGIEAIPFQKALGEKVGRAIMKLFETNRVKFYMLNEVSEMLGHHGQLKEVLLKSGKVLRADVCVIGTGSRPATGFLKGSGVHMDSKGFVPVNKTMQTNVEGVFAGGDIVTFPFLGRSNKKVNIPHWQMAHVHGRVAALGMMGRPTEIKTVPYFWSAMFGKSIRYAGYGEGFDDVVIQGDLDELKFVAFYTRSEEVIAVASMNYDPIVSRVAEVLGSGKTIRKRDVEMLTRQRKTGDMSWLIDKGSQ
ncbi:apoptosis-inducing factor 3 isoform X1 [Esox lucius]|uniref:apoptosis-inducing factor 3 isoform X1 n=1 Tax=Esox lucius TaxID=8010 RepID=UPI00097340F2|nr:apoptosis-inducing factor 3 isoform X1 [Esox lucius]XP_019908527.1 apoptosis-inducing factor 3 isoform X1 [Esox lucius]XP_019908528.1 apoptosis-inducing factor 3 isoform X1 [Esox lucius]XP_019908529.1 apoptosis-inducing factor 3 isoform X1 [Esox lucius]XP_019908530.1 apoptosis-inducing factor 3 isoform X1 [Esox lucius]XP_019908531.1 apoptosis-inducing factor 3 isoform X1 [Esox lucius]